MSEMLKTLLYLSLCGTALGLALAIVQRLVGRRLPSRFYYFAWLVVLARFALPIPGLVATERTTAEPATTTVSQPLRMAQLPTAHDDRADTPMEVTPLYDDVEPMTAEAVAVSEPTAQPEAASAQAEVEPRAPFTMPAWAPAAVWALGALGSAAWYIRGYRRFTRRVRKTLLLPRATDERVYHAIPARRRPALMRSDAVATPMLFGIFRPVIVLPNEDYDSETLPPQTSGELSVASGEASGESGQVTVEVTKPVGGQIVTVSTVDELLAAIAPGNGGAASAGCLRAGQGFGLRPGARRRLLYLGAGARWL